MFKRIYTLTFYWVSLYLEVYIKLTLCSMFNKFIPFTNIYSISIWPEYYQKNQQNFFK